jgi:glycosyltransferase involved in cell wall biosynthesis
LSANPRGDARGRADDTMRVLMVTSSYPKFPGDVTAPFIESIAHAVAARGHTVDVVLPAHPDLRRGPDEPVSFMPYGYAPRADWSLWGYAQSLDRDVRVRRGMYLLAPLAALALRGTVGGQLRERRYDAVHVHWVVPNAAFVADVVAAHGVPLVVSLHGSDVFLAERFWPARVLGGRALASAGAVTACSRDLHERGVRLGARPARTRTVPYGVDVGLFSPARETRGIRPRLGVPSSAIFVLAFGRLVEKKGFRYLLEACARVPGVHLVIAGEGALLGELESIGRDRGTPVTFAGTLDRETLATALAAADVVAVPSVVDQAGNVDGLPNALLEALASGRAVVASRLAGIPEVVDDGVNGLLVAEKDTAALIDGLRRLTADPALRARLGAAARRQAVERLSWDAAGRNFEECYVQAAALAAR